MLFFEDICGKSGTKKFDFYSNKTIENYKFIKNFNDFSKTQYC